MAFKGPFQNVALWAVGSHVQAFAHFNPLPSMKLMQLYTVDARVHTIPQVCLSNLPLTEMGSSFMVNVMSWSPAEDQPSGAQQPDV